MADIIQEEIIEEFSMFDDWLDKYDYLISLSESLPVIAPEHKTDEYIIEGCQSRVWVDARVEDGKIFYSADSDAIIIKGLLALLIRAMGNRAPQEVVDLDLYFIDAIGLKENLKLCLSSLASCVLLEYLGRLLVGKEDNYLAVVVRADGVCANALNALNFGVDNSSLVCAHRLEHNASLVAERLCRHAACEGSESFLSLCTVPFNIYGNTALITLAVDILSC